VRPFIFNKLVHGSDVGGGEMYRVSTWSKNNKKRQYSDKGCHPDDHIIHLGDNILSENYK
jgi:hypothetical protein